MGARVQNESVTYRYEWSWRKIAACDFVDQGMTHGVASAHVAPYATVRRYDCSCSKMHDRSDGQRQLFSCRCERLRLGIDIAFPLSEQLLQALCDILPPCKPVLALSWISFHVVQEDSRNRNIAATPKTRAASAATLNAAN
jgi:hypothetical protein